MPIGWDGLDVGRTIDHTAYVKVLLLDVIVRAGMSIHSLQECIGL